jgi:hypothetical protein
MIIQTFDSIFVHRCASLRPRVYALDIACFQWTVTAVNYWLIALPSAICFIFVDGVTTGCQGSSRCMRACVRLSVCLSVRGGTQVGGLPHRSVNCPFRVPCNR